ncbi:ATP-binding cassette domain-containing protein [Nocardia australiensis]|uniref:ATP-binding cassette domain-containing protein n=1 Tax=Nocardia australiensis TaxID=2887191 RepID=UPI003557F54C
MLEPGTVTAIVGTSGSGKSTLVQLLPRFFDPTHGSVALGGVDLRELGNRELYRMVSFVFQDARVGRGQYRAGGTACRPRRRDSRCPAGEYS